MKNSVIIAIVVIALILVSFGVGYIVSSLIVIKSNSQNNTLPDEGVRTYCPKDQVERLCLQIYDPVCGWSDPEKIQCIRYPCAQTYSNDCTACQNENVLYYTKGECPA